METGFEWNPTKAAANFAKHGIHFAEAVGVFEDEHALTITDSYSEPSEDRFVTIGLGVLGRVLVVVYTYRGDTIRLISARIAEPREREQYEAE